MKKLLILFIGILSISFFIACGQNEQKEQAEGQQDPATGMKEDTVAKDSAMVEDTAGMEQEDTLAAEE